MKAPCDAIRAHLGITLSDAKVWLPIRAFRLGDVYTGEDLPQTEFLSSGTSSAARARHAFSAEGLVAYAKSATEGFVTFLHSAGLPRSTPVLSLVPPPAFWPSSSLSAMIAMFQGQGLDVSWHDVEKADPLDLEHVAGRVIFGTSFHHVLAARSFAAGTLLSAGPPTRIADRLLVIDTGGTKGKTEAIRPALMGEMLQATYAPLCEQLLVGSEYGMCELASQAYSAVFPHDGRFVCNRTLRAHAVDLRARRILPAGEKGFLAFEDELAREGAPRIITEDLGVVHADGTFTLLGRAPDATLKGCSLNVKSGSPFAPGLRSSGQGFGNVGVPDSPAASVGEAEPFDAEAIARTLRATGWSPGLLGDVLPALQSIEAQFASVTSQRKRALAGTAKGANEGEVKGEGEPSVPPLAVVASANVPVVFLFPMICAYAAGCPTFELKLPSLREDDPLSTRIRTGQNALFRAVAARLPGMACRLSDRLAFSQQSLSPNADGKSDLRLVVFGTADTCAIFEARFGANVQALGEFVNAVDLTDALPAAAAIRLSEDCARYLGRGCLTPAAAYVDATFDAGAFAGDLSARLSMRFEEEGAPEIERWLHAQDMLEIRFALAQAGHHAAASCLREEAAAWVVDLRGAPEDFDFSAVPFGLGGSGLVFLLPEWARSRCKDIVQFYPTCPGLQDPHMGEPWDERIARLLKHG